MRWAVMLAGGSGTRFWPLSTPALPKHLLPLAGDRSTAELVFERLTSLVDPSRILVVAGRQVGDLLRAKLALRPDNLLVEPAPQSTGPALAWATHEARRRDPEAIVFSAHADGWLPDGLGFGAAAGAAVDHAERHRRLVTIGVAPSRPEPGFGYLVPGDALDGARSVRQFVEKPDPTRAAQLIAAGGLWNSGLFAWRAATLLEELARHTPELALALPRLDRGDVTGFFGAVPTISIDVGLLERSQAVAVVRGDFRWDDIGTWAALARVRPADARGNVGVGPVVTVDTDGSIVWSDGPPIVLDGVKDLVVVHANGRILVMHRSRADGMKALLDRLPPAVREL